MSKDYYNILEVDKGASQEEVKNAFRKKAHLYHPDKESGDEAKFKEINEAYQVLGDQQKRQQYDQYGSAAFNGAAGGAGFNWSDFMRQQAGGGQAGYDFDLGDIFGSAFGFGGRSRKSTGPQRGDDIQVMLNLEFEQAVRGMSTSINLDRRKKCSHCSGNGAEPGTAINTCDNCQGSGQETRAQQTPLGAFQVRTTCRGCAGQGQTFEKPCRVCDGSGIEKIRENLEVKVPAGIDDGETIRISSEGQAGLRGGPSGDLYVKVAVEPSRDFEREGYDILSKVFVKYPTAVLGGEVTVDTLDGPVMLKIPAGTATGTFHKLKGKGVERLHSRGRGDHLVEVVIDTPQRVSRKAKKLLAELEGEL